MIAKLCCRLSAARLLLLAAVAGAVIATPAGAAVATTVQSRPSVTTGVVAIDTRLGYANAAAAGTGMVLTASGEVLTNNHVIRGATTIRVTVPATGRTYQARVLGYSLTADVAVLRLRGASGLRTVSVGRSAQARLDQTVTAVGNAGGTGVLTAKTGTITALRRSITVNDDQGGTARLTGLIETSAALRPGDSGGPLLNDAGEVIGVDTAASAAFAFRGGGNDGYAIPIDRATAIAKQIVAGRSTAAVHVGPTAFLGVGIEPAGSSRAETSSAGGLVTTVLPNSPANSAGLEPGDVITSLDGRAVRSANSLVMLLLGKRPGGKAQLTWVDQLGNRGSATVTLANGPPQ